MQQQTIKYFCSEDAAEPYKIITKDFKLGKFGKQKGYFATLDIDIGAYLGARMTFKNLYSESLNLNR